MRIFVIFFMFQIIFLGVPFFSSKSYAGNPPTAIFHAFNMNYDQISDETIVKIKNLGFTHIQISPTQKSLEYGAWHDKYQPIAYEVGNRYGNSDQLKNLAERVHTHELKILADVVFNHLAAVQGAEGSEWKAAIESKDENRVNDLKHKLFEAYQNVFPDFKEDQVFDLFQYWNESGWMGGNLPQLNTTNPVVRKTQIEYLRKLQSLGIDGFRYDAAGSIAPESLANYENSVKLEWSYGEVISFNPDTNHFFSEILPLTDYVFTNALIKAFSPEGTLASLTIPDSNGRADSITFAVTHDTWAASMTGGQSGVNITFPNEKDGDLAALFVLARHDGVPLILAQDIEKPNIRSGLKFRSEMTKMNAKMEFMMDSNDLNSDVSAQTLIVMERGNFGIMILNKASETKIVSELDVTHYPDALGCYKQIDASNHILVTQKDGKKLLKSLKGDLKIEKRDGSFFIQVPETEC